MSGVVTRSQSQGDKENKNMETDSHDGSGMSKNLLNNPHSNEAINSGENAENTDKEAEATSRDAIKGDKSDKKSNQKKGVKVNKHGKQAGAVSRESDHAEVYKGYVADRVDIINSNPSTPTSVKMPKVKASVKTRTLVSQNGQLGLQGAHTVQGFANTLSSKLSDVVDQQKGTDSEADDSSLTSILRELATTVKKLESQLDRMEKNRKEEERKVSAIEVVQQQEVTKLQGVIEQIDDHDDRIQALIGMVVRQDQQIQTLTNQINSAHANKCQKNIIINGIPETQGENPVHKVAHFFKHVLKLKEQVPIKFARRMGKGQYKPMLVCIRNHNDKLAIFQNLDKLKEPNKSKDRPFFITDHLPEAWAERKRYIHHLKQLNKQLPAAQRHKATVKNNAVYFDDDEYQPPVTAPTVKEFLQLSAKRRRVIRELQVFKGEEESEQRSVFIGYSAQVFSVKQVEDHFHHIRLLNPDAMHIMCAFKLPGVDFTKVQGSIDDGEHGGGRVLL